MKKSRWFLVFFAAVLFLPPVFFPATAKAQGPASATAFPILDKIDVDPPSRLAPGETLIFRITGSPRAAASIKIEGVARRIPLKEVFRGIYEGAYTVRAGDQIAATSAVTGTLRLGNQELSAGLGQPLVDNYAIAVLR